MVAKFKFQNRAPVPSRILSPLLLRVNSVQGGQWEIKRGFP